ncbi:hybrid sensor histidine kinase/response regulator [Spirosoma montaniterrae]|uniref:histidine kinase n=2 Tax=Spirosoma montaniterrae TaxID=1178516 RepID=A0A1P9WSK1_9BACT|nr:hybrid sensor histidine kinase/response regulator [Spirosoma montaniterrae]
MWLQNMRWSVGLLVVGLLGWAVPVGADVPNPEYLTVRNGLPQGFIKSLIQDRRGFVWLATRDGLCRYDGVRFRIYNYDARQPRSLSFSSIYEIREDPKGRLWLRTENNNIDRFDPVTEQSEHYSATAAFRQARGRSELVGFFPDRQDGVWVATQTNGFFRLNPNGSISHQHWFMQGDTIQRTLRALLLDRRGRVWLAAKDGLFQYNPKTGQFAGFRTAQGLPQNNVLSMYERANGELLLGFPGKVAFFDPDKGTVRQVLDVPIPASQTPVFTSDRRGTVYINQNRYTDSTGLIILQPDPKLARFPVISLLVDRSNVLWVGTNGDGVIKYDLNSRSFTATPYVVNFHTDWLSQVLGVPATAIPVPVRQEWAYSVRYQFDRRKALWISGKNFGPYRFDPVRRTFDPVRPTGIEPRWLPGGSFRFTALTKGAQGELWGLLGPDSRAVVRHNPDLQTFTAFPLPLPAGHPYVIQAMTVDGGRIYLATENHGLLRADLSTKRLVRWYADGNNARALPNNALLSLAQDPIQYNYLWIGTFGSGLCRLDKMTGQIRQFTVDQGLPNNVIYGIRPDRKGHLWLSTNRGLCRFDSRTFEVRLYTTDDGLPSEEFNRFHDVALPDGRMIFGGIGGYTLFDPARIRVDGFNPVVALTALRINNQLVNALTPDSPIQQDINETKEIELRHDQNFLTFNFAALQFNQNGKNQYRYKLTGLDRDWTYSGNQATATYTNLPSGTYTFVVNASNTSGIWSTHTREIQIVIKPPLWKTWWAYLGYALVLLGAFAIYLRMRIHRVRLQSRMELREQESQQLKQLNEVKTRFFANITHEFRTPLTLILTPLQELLNETTDARQHNRLSLIYRNANRLLRLINELLDLAKLDAGNMTITLTADNLSEFVERIAASFDEEARRQNITLQVQSTLKKPFYLFDTDKVEKIINNLISNALKFTKEAGVVSIHLSAQPAYETSASVSSEPASDLVRFVVRDTGIGIEADKLPHIFNRFYQVDATTSPDGSASGSGIGLALVKELVEMMHGTISLESRPGVGSAFIVELPCRPASVGVIESLVLPLPATNGLITKPTSTDGSAPRLLLVEDNDELAAYIISVLNPEWKIRRATNGRAGIEAAIADGADLIISDVLMPELDGYELCRQLKANPITSHIPILLLTAKAAIESRLEGFNAGADDYLTKPFQVEELRGRVRNRLEQQQRMRLHYRTQLLREGHLPTASPAPQDEFMNRIYAILEERLDDTTFGVEPLATGIGMSRMHLNRKIKAMTGMTPNELIRAVRLKRGAELLLTGASVSETADRVGFDTAAYFSKVFKEQYQCTPSEYVEKSRQEVV